MGRIINYEQEQAEIEKMKPKIEKARIAQSKREKGKTWKLVNEHPKTIILNK